jgi:hypothetical protein
MTLDTVKLNEEFLAERKDLTDSEKEFARQAMAVKEEYAEKAKAEIYPIIKKYAKIEAELILELYKKYLKKAV